MKRLQEQWQQLAAPTALLEEARNSTWRRLHGSRAWKSAWLAAAAAILIGTALFIFRPQPTPLKEDAALTRLPLISRDQPAANWAGEPAVLPSRGVDQPHRPAKQPIAPKPDPVTAPPHRSAGHQLVLNFDLPESGVRVVWIKTDDFDLKAGGAE